MQITYDLHTHTSASDGSLSPEALVQAAAAAGVTHLAITDHDTLNGYLSVREKAQAYNVILIAGAEFTCSYTNQMLHVVGLGINPDNPVLQQHLKYTEQLRLERARGIAQKLQKRGLPDLLEDALHLSGGGQVGRPHFARAMVDRQLVPSFQKAFDKYLGRGKPGDVKVNWPSLEQVLGIIKGADGVSVLAHPTKYRLSLTRIRQLAATFKALGGDGIEVAYPAITADEQRSLLIIAEQNELLLSGGSDFHTPDQGWAALGRFPELALGSAHIFHKIEKRLL